MARGSSVVLWSPQHTDHFLVVNNDLRLYQIHPSDDHDKAMDTKISATATAAAAAATATTTTSGTSSVCGGQELSTSSSSVAVTTTGNTSDMINRSSDSSNVNMKNENNILKRGCVSVRAVFSEVVSTRCVAWHLEKSPNFVLAIGQGNGHITISSLSGEAATSDASSQGSITVRELVPRHLRSCSIIAWNKVYTHHLAAGLDKVRNDFSLLIWDVNATNSRSAGGGTGGSGAKVSGSEASYRPSIMSKPALAVSQGGMQMQTVSKPLVELGNSEAISSLCWFSDHPSCIVAGMGQKWLRIYDLRDDVSAPRSVAHTKAVHSVSVDPFHEYRIMSANEPEGIVRIWDVRKFSEPAFTITTGTRSLQQVAWCPTRSGMLSILARGATEVRLWDIKDAARWSRDYIAYEDTDQPMPLPDIESIVLCKSVKSHFAPSSSSSSEVNGAGASMHPMGAGSLSYFSWHPTDPKRMLTVDALDQVEDLRSYETIPLAWSPHNTICWVDTTTLYYDENLGSVQCADISDIMKQRASQGYGFDIDANVKMLPEGTPLRGVWEWIQHANGLFRKGKGHLGKIDYSFLGIKAILSATGARVMGSMGPAISRLNSGEQGIFFKVHTSPLRQLALQVCQWSFERDTSHPLGLESTLLKEESIGHFERAALLALFHLDLRRAIKSLRAGAEVRGVPTAGEADLSLVAMAMAGYTEGDSKATLWKEMCNTLRSSLTNPYLRSAFAFLTSEGKNYSPILEETGLQINDRIGFACRFLPDVALTSFVNSLLAESLSDRSPRCLDGLIVAGLTLDGVQLLQTYVDQTGDVQTASLLLGRVVPRKFESHRVLCWIGVYQDLLDTWQMWHSRALFDVDRHAFDVATRLPQQVFVRCNFCNQSISSSMLTSSGATRGGSKYDIMYMGGSGPMGKRPKISSCPGCRKPLPSCAICLIPLGAPSVVPNVSSTIVASGGEPLNLATGPGKSPLISAAGNDTVKTTCFDDWFAWCQTCRHGGHAEHIREWFVRHTQCPVSGCDCHCVALDQFNAC